MEKLLKYVTSLSLLVIAIVLVAQFILSHIWPALYSQVHYREYSDSVVACTKAIVSFREAMESPDDLKRYLKDRLLLASQVELADCHKKDLLRNKLLSNGVAEVDVQLMDLEALEDEDVPLASFVERYRK